MSGGWGQAFLLSGLPLLLLGIAAGGSFLKPKTKAWIERYVFEPGFWIGLMAYLVYSLTHNSRVGMVIAASLMGLRLVTMAWTRFSRAKRAELTTDPLADPISGTGTRP